MIFERDASAQCSEDRAEASNNSRADHRELRSPADVSCNAAGNTTQPGRRHLPTRRRNEAVTFEYGGIGYHATFGWFPTGELAEVFLDVPGKFGSMLQQHAETSAILVSLLLQHGVELHVIRHSISGPIAHALSLADAEDTH